MHVRRSFPSRRVTELAASPIREFVERASRRENVIRLEIGDSGFDTPAHILRACKEAMDDGHTRYTSFSGIFELREVLAAKLERENGIRVDPASELVITPGATGALYQALQATVDPGDEVLTPSPGWSSFAPMITLAGGIPVYYPCFEDDEFTAQAEHIAPLITAKTKALIINSPSNPTGGVSRGADLQAICQLVREHELLLISDEVYERILFDGSEHVSPASLSDMSPRTLTINSVSKTFAMTGWRVGYAAGPADVIAAMSKLNFYTNVHPNSPAQYASVAAYASDVNDVVETMRAAYRQRRDFMVKHLGEMPGVRCTPPRGSVFLFPSIAATGMSSMEFAGHLLDRGGVAAVPGVGFGPHGEGYLRLCFAQPMEVLEQAIERIAKVAAELAG